MTKDDCLHMEKLCYRISDSEERPIEAAEQVKYKSTNVYSRRFVSPASLLPVRQERRPFGLNDCFKEAIFQYAGFPAGLAFENQAGISSVDTPGLSLQSEVQASRIMLKVYKSAVLQRNVDSYTQENPAIRNAN